MKNNKLPELLSPAGSKEAFCAAIDGGADAIYVGGASFNARINAKNFTEDELRESIKLAHLYGVKVYQTVNTMLYGRELDDFLRAAERSANDGIDAFIVSDLGGAMLLKKYLPEIPLHASTQMSIHSSDGAKLLAQRGFSRVVPARELSRGDIKEIVDKSGLEVEIFIHGALCVSHSGQCLFSSLVGGRSGNRGLCAQPCRLPYACAEGKVSDQYPLSLKDVSLAAHVKEIVESGVASLKIEGRMKSPEYVRGVTAIWRRLLDERRDATAEDVKELSNLFSRGGFTDSYYTRSLGRKMLGIRSDEDKQASREVERFDGITRKIPVDMRAVLRAGEQARLTVVCGERQIIAKGDEVQRAINAPMDAEAVRKSLSKLGDTPFYLDNFESDIDNNVMLPVSKLNALRRDAIALLTDAMASRDEKNDSKSASFEYSHSSKAPKKRNVGRFYRKEQITESARGFFDIVLLPLSEFAKYPESADGFIMPPVIFDSEKEATEKLLERAKGAKYAVITNLGQIETIKRHIPEAKLIADLRFNIANDESVVFFEELGFESCLLSTELTLPQIRDIKGTKAAVVYGRIPLMTLEKCVIKELYGDRGQFGSGRACDKCAESSAEMKDRRGFIFPVLREPPHRNIVLNSLPTQMSDKQQELLAVGITDRHFLFTIESTREVNEIIDDYKLCRAPKGKARRI